MKDMLTKNISFAYNEALELIIAMGMVACEEQMEEVAKEYKFELDPLATDFHQEAREQLSPHALRELEFFFKYNFLHKALDFGFYLSICDCPKIQSAEEWIAELDQIPADKIMAGMVYGVYHDKMDELLQGRDWEYWKEVQRDLPALIELVKATEPHPEVAGAFEPLLECLTHPLEAKHRYMQVIRQFYQDAYKPWAKRIKDLSEASALHYGDSFKEEPETFIRETNKSEPALYDLPTIFHISFLSQVSNHLIYSNNGQHAWVIFGIHNDRVFGPDADREKVELFFKALSDKRRMDFVSLLRVQPRYGAELAAELGITPAAVNYHANFLFFLDLLEMKRSDHRMYYHLKTERLRELLALTSKVLLDE
ncbi:hypothetical protein GCM10008013_30310 [Paenibacillus segetis]|uniref:HTH arsR-type domain-containing protein n=2 Tax=Paenibacillus segetis TaxID=1325360 RepID=A0ABQ1YJC7_9BACL|nr:hypothetical protein GCM10008013_30310 [Paenibacillus segetis]